MKKTSIFVLLFLSCLCSVGQISAAIRILCTACLLPDEYENRKQMYINSLAWFKHHGLSVYMVESCQPGPTELDKYCDNIYYAQTQISGLNNYGENEARALQAALDYFDFDDEDIIIKFTGKYEFQTTEFIDLVNHNLDAAAIARMWTFFDAYSVLFAMKMNHFREFFRTISYNDMRRGGAFEHILGLYITDLENKGEKIVHWPRVYNYLPTTCGFK